MTMTPGQQSAKGHQLKVENAGRYRQAAHVFDLPEGGIAYIDAGWTDPLFSGHACHILRGTVDQVIDEPATWLLINADGGDHVIEVLPDAPEGDRELARRVLERDLDMALPDIPIE